MNKIIFVIATFVVAILITVTGGIGYNNNQNFQIIQSMNGKMTIQSKGGITVSSSQQFGHMTNKEQFTTLKSLTNQMIMMHYQ